MVVVLLRAEQKKEKRVDIERERKTWTKRSDEIHMLINNNTKSNNRLHVTVLRNDRRIIHNDNLQYVLVSMFSFLGAIIVQCLNILTYEKNDVDKTRKFP